MDNLTRGVSLCGHGLPALWLPNPNLRGGTYLGGRSRSRRGKIEQEVTGDKIPSVEEQGKFLQEYDDGYGVRLMEYLSSS